MHIVLGIGNPGKEYQGTRHNIGFEVLDVLAGRFHASFRKWKARAMRAGLETPAGPLLLVKPLTYVNLSGKIIPLLMESYGPLTQNVLVICDDFHLPLGSIRVRRKGSSGGHNGLKSLIEAMGSDDFPRLRIGVGAPEGEDAADYVLDRFRKSERPVLDPAVGRAAEAVECWARDGIDRCMNLYNSREK